MIATLDRFADDEIPVPEGSSVAELRAFYAEWRSELMKLSITVAVFRSVTALRLSVALGARASVTYGHLLPAA